MGLSIHYELNASSQNSDEIFALLERLRSQAQQLSFHEVEARVEHLSEKDCSPNSGEPTARFLPLVASRLEPSTLRWQTPTQVIGFTALPRLGSEALPVFLAQYPNSKNWLSSGHCKTVFAGLPKYGGTANFVLAHTMVVEVLRQAQQLGIVKSVFDESGYWEEHSLLCLVDRGELPTLADEVSKQAGSIPPDFVMSLLAKIQQLVC